MHCGAKDTCLECKKGAKISSDNKTCKAGGSNWLWWVLGISGVLLLVGGGVFWYMKSKGDETGYESA